MAHLIAGSLFSGLMLYFGYWSVVVSEEERKLKRAKWAGTHKRRMNKQSVKQFRELCERFAKNESIIITFIEEKDIDGCLSVLFHTDRALPNDINFRLTCWLASQDKANYQNMTGWFMSDYFSLRDEPSIEKNLA